MHNTTEIEKAAEDYPLIPMNEIEDEARLLAVRWVENYGTMGFDIQNKHKLASDIMNYAIRQFAKRSNFEAFAIESIKENEKTQIGEVDFTGKTHELKTWSEYFQKVKAREKKFEVRRNDRDFKIGDRLLLKEFIPTGYNSVSPNEIKGEYTGYELTVVITYILKVKPHEASLFGISSDTCVMSIEWLDESATDKPEELQEEVEKLIDGWISVEDKMPEYYDTLLDAKNDFEMTQKVIVITDRGNITDKRRVKMLVGGKEWTWFMSYGDGDIITHWMEFKKPPNKQ